MDRFWRPLSTNIDEDGLEFISILEAKNYPIFATQGFLILQLLFSIKREMIFEMKEQHLKSGYFSESHFEKYFY